MNLAEHRGLAAELLHLTGLALIGGAIRELAGWPWAALFAGVCMVGAYWLDAVRSARGRE